MAQQKTKAEVFNLIIDEERCELFQIMVVCTMKDLPNYILAHPDRAGTILPVMKEFIEEFVNKMHEQGWCKDKDCKHNKHK